MLQRHFHTYPSLLQWFPQLIQRLTFLGRLNSRLKHGQTVTIWVWTWKCWVNIPNEIAIFHRDNDQQNHWVQWGTRHFQTHPYNSNGACKGLWAKSFEPFFFCVGVRTAVPPAQRKECSMMGVCVCVSVSVSLCVSVSVCVCVGKHRKIMIHRTRLGRPIFKQTHADHQYHDHHHHNDRRGCQWCFHRLSVSFLLSFSEALASHLDQRIYIVFSLWDVSLQPPDLHVFFDKISFLQSWNDAIACARHTVSLQGRTWNLNVTAAFRAPHLRSSLWRYHHSNVSNHGRVNGEQST